MTAGTNSGLRVELVGDADGRARALDPTRSFLVEAPAGSGKTELLIQRYLTLLARVQEPEQIVAISFTRKAAAEMRARVLALLRGAESSSGDTAGHRMASLRLARTVIARDRVLGWSLLRQPQRMRIDTVDALNAWLANRLPLLSGAVAGMSVTEDAAGLYRLAARRCVDGLGDSGPVGAALRTELDAADSSVERLERRLAAMLPSRDQWLRLLALGDTAQIQGEIEAALAILIAAAIERVRSGIGDARYARLSALLGHAAGRARPAVEALERWADSAHDGGSPSASLAAWQAAAKVLLTSGGKWRARFSVKQGFLPGADATAEIRALVVELGELGGLREALIEVTELPDPATVISEPERLRSLQTVLKQLLAELSVVFEETGTVDFTELALAAQHALGAVDAPSDLLLALDRKLEHLLVDEFQDTSQSQFRLLELLTAGWTEGDGRTLFLVGDPMQSIYRFRDADLSLFLLARRTGVGAVRCEHVVLEDNHRSAPAVVDWVNTAFADIFRGLDAGSVDYRPCRARRPQQAEQAVSLHGAADADAELSQVVGILEHELTRAPDQSIAILVQSRKHLEGLHSRLSGRGWPVHAIEIESLAQHQLGQDLLGLTRALTHLGDRIAWLGVLRSPWCGLTWRDLEALCADSSERAIWESIRDADTLERLSEDGARRLEDLVVRLDSAFERRATLPLAQWIETTWRLLDGPMCLMVEDDVDRAERFFRMLERTVSDGDIADTAALEDAFGAPQELGSSPTGAGIEIMTIHRAKGLEFDTVVLFGLGRKVGAPEQRLLHRHQARDGNGRGRLLLAPADSGRESLAPVLRRIDRRLEHAERARLLYVAATRARERLHLIATRPDGEPRAGTLLSWLWPRFAADFTADGVRDAASSAGAADPRVSAAPALRRLARGQVARRAPRPQAAAGARPPFEWVTPTAVQVGTLVHRELSLMGREEPASPAIETLGTETDRYRRELLLLGVPPEELTAATTRVATALERVAADPTGRWVLAAHHDARSELSLTLWGGGLEHVRLDRTFVDERGTRWIIDYKTSDHTGGDLEGFLDSEVERYRPQLARYAAAMREIDDRPIRAGLYFPLLTTLRDWDPLTAPEGSRSS